MRRIFLLLACMAGMAWGESVSFIKQPDIDLSVRTTPQLKPDAYNPRFVDTFSDLASWVLGGTGSKTLVSSSFELEDCDDAWTANTNVTGSLDTTNKIEGTGCVQLVVASNFFANSTSGIICYEWCNNLQWNNYEYIEFYIYPTVTITENTLKFLVADSVANLTDAPSESLFLPALVANKWNYVRLTLATPATYLSGTYDYYGLKTVSDTGACTIRIDDVRATSDRPTTGYIATAPNFGATAIKMLGTSADGGSMYLAKAITSTVFDGCDIRLRYFVDYRDDYPWGMVDDGPPPTYTSDFSRASIYFMNGAADSGTDFGRIQLPCRDGWNEVEIPFANVVSTGTFDPSAGIQYLKILIGTSTNLDEDARMLKSGEYAILDHLEVIPTGLTKGYVIIQFDDGVIENFDEMAPYCAKYNIPVQIFVMPEKVGTANTTTPSIRYASWEQIEKGVRENVLLGVHGPSAIGTNISALAIEEWCRNHKRPLIDRGLIRGSDYVALPAGQVYSLGGEEALAVMQKYFVNIRGVYPYYQEDQGVNQFTGLASYGFNNVKPKNYAWSWAIGFNESDNGGKTYTQTYVDTAIAHKAVLILFAHGLSERSGGYWSTLTRANFQAEIDYIAGKIAAGTLEAITIEDLINGSI